MSPHVARVVPYVEDRRNCLLFEPGEQLDEAQMASLQAALKNAIQVRYQLEDNELAAEPLPDLDSRRQLLNGRHLQESVWRRVKPQQRFHAPR